MERQRGFTVIELIVAIVFLGVIAVIFFIQKNDIEMSARNQERRTAINAMYYGLEEVYYPDKKSYPQELTEKTLPYVDPELFTDPEGVKIGDSQSEYRYEPTGCQDGKCSGFTLRADLENQEDFIKQSE